MLRRAALTAILAASTLPAHADDQSDLFGLPKKRKAEGQAKCDTDIAFGCAMATDPLDEQTPYALRTWLSRKYLETLPIGNANQDQVAPFALGAYDSLAGVSFDGATGLENRWTIEGAPVESARTGGVDVRVPVTFLDQLLVTAGGFSARDRVGTGGTIEARLVRGTEHHEVDARVWLGDTTAAKQRPIAPGSYVVRRVTAQAGAQFDASVVATGPIGKLEDGKLWYAAGVAPTLQLAEFTWRAARLVDTDNDGIPDGFPGTIVLDPIETTHASAASYLIPVMARVGWDRDVHHVDATFVGNFAHVPVFLGNATLTAAGVDRDTRAGVAMLTWRGNWKETRGRVQLAWHRSEQRESPHDDRANIPQLFSAYVPAELPEDPLLASQCVDDITAKFAKCPVPVSFFASGGAGLLVDRVSDHPTVTADVAHQLGDHVVRAGATLEDTRLVQTSRYTGGDQVRSLFPGHSDTRRFFTTCEPAPDSPCEYAAASELTFRTRYTAAYLEDTFEPVKGLRVDAGLRWELMWVGPRLHFSDEWAPRIGLAWDPLGEGRSRVWASLGRSYVLLPAGLGTTVIARDRLVHDVDAGPFGTARQIDSGAVYSVADGIEAAAQDEATMGIEAGLAKLARATLWLQGRTLRRGYETVLANEATGQADFDNPGRDGRTPASRDAFTIAFEMAVFASKTTTLRGGLSWNITRGSWPGPFDPRQGVNLLAGTDYDLDASNLDGVLPSDGGARGYFELVRRGHLGGFEVGVASRLVLQSGLPRDVLADSDFGIVQLLPRGSAGRELMQTEANIRLSAKVRGFDVTLDVFDVFDRRDVAATNRIFVSDDVLPIHGGTASDLVFLKTEEGRNPALNPGFGLPTLFVQPLSFLLGVRRPF